MSCFEADFDFSFGVVICSVKQEEVDMIGLQLADLLLYNQNYLDWQVLCSCSGYLAVFTADCCYFLDLFLD